MKEKYSVEKFGNFNNVMYIFGSCETVTWFVIYNIHYNHIHEVSKYNVGLRCSRIATQYLTKLNCSLFVNVQKH